MSGNQGLLPTLPQGESVGLDVLPAPNDTHIPAIPKQKVKPATIILEFLKEFVSCVGIGNYHGTWWTSVMLALVFAVMYWVVAYGSLHFITHNFASFWAPNGIYSGALLRARPYERRYIIFAILNLAFGNTALNSLYYVILNSIECLTVASFSLGLVRVLRPTKISLLHREHLIGVGLGIIIGCSITANLSVNYARWKLNPPHNYGSTYLGYIGRNLVGQVLVVPLILSVPYPTSAWNHALRTKARPIGEAFLIAVILVTVPTVSAYIVKGTALSTVAGLYVTYPAVLVASAKFGLVGASGASLVVGIASAVSTLIWSDNVVDKWSTSQLLSAKDQFVWIHLFLVVLVATSIFFVIILTERDAALAKTEKKVKDRSEDLKAKYRVLDQRLTRARRASNDRAFFFRFLCNELSNPLHDMTGIVSAMEMVFDPKMADMAALKMTSTYMHELIADVLDLGRYERNKVKLDDLAIDIHQLFKRNTECAQQVAATNGIRFEPDVDFEVPRFLRADPIRLQLVFDNLISNALTRVQSGGLVHLKIRVLQAPNPLNPILPSGSDALEPQKTSSIAPSSHDQHGDVINPSHNSQSVTPSLHSSGGGLPRKDLVRIPSFSRKDINDFKYNNSNKNYNHNNFDYSYITPLCNYLLNNNNNNNLLTSSSSDPRTSSIMDTTDTYPPTRTTSYLSAASERAEADDRGKGPQQSVGGQGGEEEQEERSDKVIMEVTVEDSGAAIEPNRETVEALFRPFASTGKTSKEYCGSGLKLAIANQIVHLMGGVIDVATPVGGGCRFILTVPFIIASDIDNALASGPAPGIFRPLTPPVAPRIAITPESAANATTTATTPAAPVESNSAPHPDPQERAIIFKILMVDDSEMNIRVLSLQLARFLRKGAYSITAAVNGREGVDTFNAHVGEDEFDLIFMDIVMPVMDGIEACTLIRATGYTKPIVMATANQVTEREEHARIMAAGATDAIMKPFDKNDIQRILKTYGIAAALK